MLSKALPVSQENSTCEEHNDNDEIQQSTQGSVVETTGTLSQPTEENGVAETSQPIPSGPTINQQQVLHEPMAPKPADDRLFTWAAFGLTIAIVVLLLKKFLKANGHGAVFMNES